MSDVSERAKQAADQFIAGIKKQTSRLWIVGAGICVVLIAFNSCAEVEPGQVAIRVNNVTGEQETISQPGLIVELPFGVHDTFVVDTSSQTFHMRGDRDVDELNVKELSVRAKDGSVFVFNDTTIIYRVVPDSAAAVLRDAGRGHRYRLWIQPYVRSILRDEFGKESTLTVSTGNQLIAATERAKVRLNEFLNPHGLEVTSIVTPRPKFNPEYERLVETRNETEQQKNVITSELTTALSARNTRLAEVDRDQNKIIKEKRAALETALAQAVTEQTQARREVDGYKIEKVAAGQSALSAAQTRAKELDGQLKAELRTRRAEIDAFKNQPIERVMERLGERLQGVTINIQPWANDAAPSRVQYETVGGGR